MEAMTGYLEQKLKLQVNRNKSAVAALAAEISGIQRHAAQTNLS